MDPVSAAWGFVSLLVEKYVERRVDPSQRVKLSAPSATCKLRGAKSPHAAPGHIPLYHGLLLFHQRPPSLLIKETPSAKYPRRRRGAASYFMTGIRPEKPAILRGHGARSEEAILTKYHTCKALARKGGRGRVPLTNYIAHRPSGDPCCFPADRRWQQWSLWPHGVCRGPVQWQRPRPQRRATARLCAERFPPFAARMTAEEKSPPLHVLRRAVATDFPLVSRFLLVDRSSVAQHSR